MLYLIISLIAYFAIAFFVWKKFTSTWESNTKFERVYFAGIWPLTGILYICYCIHNWKKLFKKNEKID